MMEIEFKASDYPDDNEKKMIQPEFERSVFFRHTNSSFGLNIQPSSSKLTCGSNNVIVFISGPANSEIEFRSFVSSGGKLLSSGTTSVLIGSNNEKNDFIGEAVSHF